MKRFQLMAAGILSLLILAACSDGTTQPGAPRPSTAPTATALFTPTPSAPASSSTSRSTDDVAATAVGVYRAMWEDMVVAGTTADYRSPRLADHAASQAWQLLYGGLRSAHQDGTVFRGQPTFSPRVTAVTPTAAPVAVSILDCMDSTNWLEYTTAGQPKDDKPGGKHRATATVGLLNGTWKVTRLQVEDVGTCT